MLRKAQSKRWQHFKARYPSLVGHNMLRVFGHPVAMCCNMLGVVGSSLKIVKFSMQHFWMLHSVVVVSVRATNVAPGKFVS